MQIDRSLVVVLFAVAAFGQSTPAEPSFEVAEIRVNVSGATDSRGDISNGRLLVRNISLRQLVAEAWNIKKDDVVGPAWLDDSRVDIVAKAASPTTSLSEVRQMMQTLLKERMKLVAHVEQREKQVWALTIWKGAPKLTPSEMPVKPEDADCSLKNGASGVHYACRHMSMALLAHKLPDVAGQYADKPVIDQTGLAGAWEFALNWTPFSQLESNGGLTLFAALQAQLGLQLMDKKLLVPVVIVESMEKIPTDN